MLIVSYRSIEFDQSKLIILFDLIIGNIYALIFDLQLPQISLTIVKLETVKKEKKLWTANSLYSISKAFA